MKRILVGLTALGLICLNAPAFAASATGTTQVQINVAADASISVPATCVLTTAGGFAQFAGTCAASSYSVRTTKAGGTGSIVLSTAADWAGANTGPTLAGDVFNFTNAGNAGGPGTLNAGPTRIAATGTNYNVVTGMGANAHANNVSFTTSFTLANNPAWETGAYTIDILYTLSAT